MSVRCTSQCIDIIQNVTSLAAAGENEFAIIIAQANLVS